MTSIPCRRVGLIVLYAASVGRGNCTIIMNWSPRFHCRVGDVVFEIIFIMRLFAEVMIRWYATKLGTHDSIWSIKTAR